MTPADLGIVAVIADDNARPHMINIELDSREIDAINRALEIATVTYGADYKKVLAPSVKRDLEARAVFAAQLRRKF